MKRITVMLAVVVMAVLFALPAGAVVIDFDSNSPGDIVSGPGVYSDLIFSNEGRDITVHSVYPGAEFSSPNCALGTYVNNYFAPYRADFRIREVNYVSVVLGDFDADDDKLYLRAYNRDGFLLDMTTYFLDSTVYGGPTLSVSASNIAYVIFGGVGGNVNSVFFDDFTYEVVPEPGSLFALAGGLFGLGGIIRFRRRR